jgi:prepilin-type N-terminal cleavage/methylation domain-containing protein
MLKHDVALNKGLRKQAGFTLIELLIVIAIIGLIMVVVVKGSDLINDANILNFAANPVHELEVDAMAYYTRTGTFPNGNNTTKGPMYNMWNAGITDVLNVKSPFITNSITMAVALGVVPFTNTDWSLTYYPVIAILPVTYTPSTNNFSSGTITIGNWTPDAISYAVRLKQTIDGNQDWYRGRIRIYDMAGGNFGFGFVALYHELNLNSNLLLESLTYDGYVTMPYSSTSNLNVSSAAFGQPPQYVKGLSAAQYPLFYFYYKAPY